MKTNLVRTALACAVLLLAATAAMAGDPIPGVDVDLGKNPGGNAITATTDADGRIVFKGLTPGDYVLVIDGKSLDAAIDKSAPHSGSGGSTIRVEIKFEGTANGSSNNFAVETCACNTGQPIRLGFTIPAGNNSTKMRQDDTGTETVVVTGSHLPQQ
ncbi:MAG TPA: carboxypeptidase-like regulatory domain-containing protein [Rhizomicrobium sp.]